jgi:hypothetical protein
MAVDRPKRHHKDAGLLVVIMALALAIALGIGIPFKIGTIGVALLGAGLVVVGGGIFIIKKG